MERAQAWAERGDSPVLAPPATSTTPQLRQYQQSYPGATVTVYLTGTGVLATIYSDNSSTPLSNPFTADQFGHWFFYAANGTYDVQISGAGLATPYTIGGILLFDPTAGFGVTTLTFTQEADPGVSAIGQSIIYMDASTHTLMVSQNGAAYVPLLSGGSSGGSITDYHLLTATTTVISPSVTPAPANTILQITIQQDSTGGRLVTWTSDFLVTPPDLATLPGNSYSVLTFTPVGGKWLLAGLTTALS